MLISSSEAGQRLAHHTNVIQAAKTAGTARILYTSMFNAEDTFNPLAGEHQDTERIPAATNIPFTLLRNGWYTENCINQLDQYLQSGEILGAAGCGRISQPPARTTPALPPPHSSRTTTGTRSTSWAAQRSTCTRSPGPSAKPAAHRSPTTTSRYSTTPPA